MTPTPRFAGLALAGFATFAACQPDDARSGKPAAEPATTTTPTAAEDLDGDGYRTDQGDCNDRNDAIFPDAREISLDGVDSNCDGQDLPPSSDDLFPAALAVLDLDADGAISLAEFTLACETSAQFAGDARPGVVHTHATCGGTNACRGMILHPWNQLFDHDCRGVNGCAGWSCVETAADLGRDGATVFTEATCNWCHGGEDGAFKVEVPPGQDVQAWTEGFLDRSDERFRAAIAFGVHGISPGEVAYTNMPAFYQRLSLREIDAVIDYVRTLPLEGAAFTWGDDESADES